jgi:multicomponent Na+:H+ antiporter subunit A
VNDAALHPGIMLALVAGAIVVGAAIAIVRARSLLAISLVLAAGAAALAAAFLALDAPDLALIEALLGVAMIPLWFLGAMVLTAPSARKRVGKPRLGALAAAIAVGAALTWAASDLPVFGGEIDNGLIYVNRAIGETGVRNAVSAATGNYRAIDALAEIGALMAAGLGVFALLGFGERAAGRERKSGDAP